MEWRQIPGYSRYEINRVGKVRRLLPANSPMVKVGMILKPQLGNKGRLVLDLRKDNGSYSPVFIHHLVAVTYISPKPSFKHQVDHIDRNKQNNRDTNLRWVTSKENHANADHSGERNGCAKLDWKKVRSIRKLAALDWKQWEIGELYNITQANVSCIVLGKSWKEKDGE